MEEQATPLFVEERKRKIMEMLSVQSKLYVSKLCKEFGVSPVTIRSDLQELEQAGLLQRTHGGAIPVSKASYEPTSHAKEISHMEEKKRIAAKAAELVEPGDTICLDTGTTIYELAKQLTGKRNLNVITNDLQIAMYLEENLEDCSLIVLGGTIRRGFHCTVGPIALSSIKNLNVDKAFMAANACTLEKGFTTPSIEQAEVKRALMSIASQSIMLVDSSKFGQVSMAGFARIDDMDKLITDKGLHPGTRSALQSACETMELILV